MKRTLVVRKESLAELTPSDLSGVAAGSHTCITYSILLTGCMCSGMYPSLNIDCKIADAIELRTTGEAGS